MSITNFPKYCKSRMGFLSHKSFQYYLQGIILTAVCTLLVTESFYISFIMDYYYNTAHTITIEKSWLVPREDGQNELKSDLKIVASKSGKRYYFLHCSGVKRIKEVNKIYFKSENDAKKRGLTLASNCD